MTLFTLADLAQLTQELLNDPNLKHKNITEKAAIYGQAATVLSAEQYARELGAMRVAMTSALEAQIKDDDITPAPRLSYVRLVSDELERLHQLASILPESERKLMIPDWTQEELMAVHPLPPATFGELCVAIREAVTSNYKWDGCAPVLIKLEELADHQGHTKAPVWSARPDLDELHQRLEWALQSIRDQVMGQ